MIGWEIFSPQIIVNNSRNLSDLQVVSVVMKFFLKYWTLLKDDSLCCISTLFEVYECITLTNKIVLSGKKAIISARENPNYIIFVLMNTYKIRFKIAKG